ncbi:phosphotransferase [Beijerinckia sp. L45]|uniref:phosphotransferase n=1 Tax=Beijerinckia sp. L45 TaxID=1641855 RepID=UPI00131CE5BD|nr:phosphotransferase [Beijerinckia sp. L45]
MPDRDQTAVVEALRSGSATGALMPLKQIDTHVSRIFLGCEHAYKLKRAVRLPFLDFTTIEARRSACESELAANTAFAPSLYEGVLPVVRAADGHVSLDGPGDVLDWVVVMRRLPDGSLLDEMAMSGTLTSALITQAVDTVARFHTGATPCNDAGRPADYRKWIDGLRLAETSGAGSLKVSSTSGTLFDMLEREVIERSDLIDARRRAGFVRRGHGDLHLGNVCVFEGRVTPFDALEFDPALATTDVLYDVAFLLMDLRARALAPLANVAMNRYWDVTGQSEEALALLPLFMGMRAAVRMAVAGERGDLAGAARYRDVGLSLVHRSLPRLVAIGGLSGTGKSNLARRLAPAIGGHAGLAF